MFNQNSGYSLSDIAAVSGRNNSGFGDGDGWWIILLILFAGGWGGNGWGGNGTGTTREEIAYGFDMNGLENGIRGIQQGLCDGFYAVNTGMLNGFSNIQNSLCSGFAGVNAAITNSTIADMQNTNAIQGGLTALSTQLAQCCCDQRYDLATQSCETRRAIADSTRDIVASNESGVRAILDFLTQDKIASLTAENQSLKFAASQAAQNAFIVANQEAQTAELIRRLDMPSPIPAYVVNPPFPVGYYKNGCGDFYNYGSCGC